MVPKVALCVEQSLQDYLTNNDGLSRNKLFVFPRFVLWNTSKRKWEKKKKWFKNVISKRCNKHKNGNYSVAGRRAATGGYRLKLRKASWVSFSSKDLHLGLF